MKNITLLSIFVMALTTLGSFANAGLLYPYSRLALKDLDQMNKLVQEKIKESQKAGGDQVIPLKEALQAVFSRPNDDDMIEKVMSSLRTELDEHNAYEKSVRSLVREATGALKNPKAFGAEAQVTYAIFLENVISEVKPRAGETFEHAILKSIKDANIDITKAASTEFGLRMMKTMHSPSQTATEALAQVDKAKEASAAKEVQEEKSLDNFKSKALAKPAPGATPVPTPKASPTP